MLLLIASLNNPEDSPILPGRPVIVFNSLLLPKTPSWSFFKINFHITFVLLIIRISQSDKCQCDAYLHYIDHRFILELDVGRVLGRASLETEWEVGSKNMKNNDTNIRRYGPNKPV